MVETNSTRPILLTGGSGQLGWELQRALCSFGPLEVTSRETLDLRDTERVRRTVARLNPWVIVNAAAYTSVDAAESEPDRAYGVNAEGPRALTRAAQDTGAWLVHYSTDYVFDGSGDEPWRETDEAAPLSVYGQTKRAGEEAVLGSDANAVVFRTSWVVGTHGENFLKSILTAALTRKELKVVSDQFATPTPAFLLAHITAFVLREALAGRRPVGPEIYHLAPHGVASWHSYAELAVSYARELGAPLQVEQIHPISSEEWPTAAERPRNSLLDCSKVQQALNLRLPDWEFGVRRVIESLYEVEVNA